MQWYQLLYPLIGLLLFAAATRLNRSKNTDMKGLEIACWMIGGAFLLYSIFIAGGTYGD